MGLHMFDLIIVAVIGLAIFGPKAFQSVARNAGKVLLHRQVLQAIWGSEYGDEADYVWTFVQRIRRKLEPDRHHPRYVLTEAGVGYWMPTPDSDTEATPPAP